MTDTARRAKPSVIALLVIAALLLVAASFGPSLIAGQSQRASLKCANESSGSVSSIDWRVMPRPGWYRESDGATQYIGWWVG